MVHRLRQVPPAAAGGVPGATKAGAIIATLDEPDAASAWPELEQVLAAMIAARS